MFAFGSVLRAGGEQQSASQLHGTAGGGIQSNSLAGKGLEPGGLWPAASWRY